MLNRKAFLWCFILAILISFSDANAGLQKSQPATITEALPTLSPLVKRVAPAVVNISSESATTKGSKRPSGRYRKEEEAFREFFEKFFGEMPEEAVRRKALGSGFFIDSSGLILTNNHVVEKATTITVVTADRKEYKAKVIGRDPKTDLALIKIAGGKEGFPALPLGDSDQTEVGDWVISVGNPLGLASTVTQGIISAKARVIGLGPYDNFLQTDAPLNPGNSGGPLVNLRGEVIGVTTAMATAQAIGFAIPSNLARTIIDQLREKGRVIRGFIGVSVQEITPKLAQGLGLKEARGALVGDVVEGGPAGRAGIKTGDVIIEFAGKPIRSSSDLPLLVAGTPVGKVVPVTILRDGKEVRLNLQVQELKEEKKSPAKGKEDAKTKGELGMSLADITPQIQKRLQLKEKTGVLVTDVRSGSPASEAGIEEGDVVLSVNRKRVDSVAEFRAAVQAVEKGRPLLLQIRREENTLFVTVDRS